MCSKPRVLLKCVCLREARLVLLRHLAAQGREWRFSCPALHRSLCELCLSCDKRDLLRCQLFSALPIVVTALLVPFSLEAPRTDGGLCCARAGRAAAKQGLCTAADGGGWHASRSPCGKQVTLSCHPVNKAVCHSSALSRARAAFCSRVCTAAHSLSQEQGLLLLPGALQIRSGM